MRLQESDPYFEGKISELQSNFLNFTPYASSSNPQVYCFSGNAFSLKMKSDDLQKDFSNQQFAKYKSLRINLSGTMVKANNVCCFIWTIIMGSILLFPLFFLCCDWWKKRAYRIYNVQNCGYDALTKIIKHSNAQELYLNLQDNLLNHSKAETIIQALQQSRIKNLIINNVAPGFDCEGSNYSNFPNYMKPVKSIILRSDVSWGSMLVK